MLAAGFSRRFGASDKLMHVLGDGTPVALKAAQNLLQALPLTIAAVRADNAALSNLLADAGVEVIHCAEHQRDMSDSLAAAIRHAANFSEADDGFVIALGDMPYIRPATIAGVAAALADGAAIAMPIYRQQRGHPVAFSARCRTELENLCGDEGARAIVRRYQSEVSLLECDDAGILADIDTPTDVR
ncbi:MAG TPA: nucleotidyltransferase family protein [Oxalicibacterium sp.]|nr:nucleotidyltransferase family protein [Oxalicibacterium sp.]